MGARRSPQLGTAQGNDQSGCDTVLEKHPVMHARSKMRLQFPKICWLPVRIKGNLTQSPNDDCLILLRPNRKRKHGIGLSQGINFCLGASQALGEMQLSGSPQMPVSSHFVIHSYPK